MLTRCPYCGTTFRVTPDQLKVRLGQVRCGQCRRVFDALRDLAEDAVRSADQAKPAPTPEAPPPQEHELTWTIVQPEPPGTNPPRNEPAPDPNFAFVAVEEPTVPDEPETEPEAEAPIGFEPVDEYIEEIHIEPVVPLEADDEVPSDVTPVSQEPLAEPAIEADDILGPETEPQEEPVRESAPAPEPEPVFQPVADTEPMLRPRFEPMSEDIGPPTIFELHEPPAGRSLRWPWILGGLIAAIVLAAQVLLHYRTELIAAAPETRPAFAAICEQLGCELALPHKINLIGIETSDLVPDEQHPGTLHLTTLLRNRAPYTQAWPHLEVTLTDAQERPLLRRALAPDEYIAAPDALAGGFPARSEHPVQLTLTATDIPAVGYRIYVFYP